MNETTSFRQGYIASWENGFNFDTPDVNWQRVAPGDIVGSLKNTSEGWHLFPSAPVVSIDPLRCENSVWPGKLHKVEIPPEAMSTDWKPGQVRSNAVRVTEEVDPTEILGSQKDQLLAMAAKLIDLTSAQQQALFVAAGPLESTYVAKMVVRELAISAGRYNTSAAIQLMLHERSKIWSRHAVGNAALAIVHKDLLEQQGLWGLYGELLYRPWKEVVEEK